MAQGAQKDHSYQRQVIQIMALSRVVLAILFALLINLLPHSTPLLGSCVLLLAILEIAGLLNGYLARRWHNAQEWGVLLLPFADNTSRLVAFWALASAGLALPLVPLVMALCDVTVAYSRITLTRFEQSASTRFSDGAKAIIQGAAGPLLVLGPMYWEVVGRWPIAATSWTVMVVTAASVVVYARTAVNAAVDARGA